MKNDPLPALDKHDEIRRQLLPYCRFQTGEIWEDPLLGHKIACGDATDHTWITSLMNGEQADLAIHDPPYNHVAFGVKELADFVSWCKQWVAITASALKQNASLYVWLGADQKKWLSTFA